LHQGLGSSFPTVATRRRRIALCAVLVKVLACLILILGLSLVVGCGSDDGPKTITLPQKPTTNEKKVNDKIAQAQEEARIKANYDSLVRKAIDSINDYWARTVPAVYGAEYEPPEISGGYDPDEDSLRCDGEDKTGKGNAFYCKSDNYIAWDEPTFFFDLYKRVALGPTFVLAHEWGHAIQRQLRAKYATRIHYELDADCLAGAWVHDAIRRSELTRDDLDSAVRTLIEGRDPEGLPWLDPSAHGSAYERTRAFGDGVDGGPTLCIPAP
jgi:predicted metalloprotease